MSMAAYSASAVCCDTRIIWVSAPRGRCGGACARGAAQRESAVGAVGAAVGASDVGDDVGATVGDSDVGEAVGDAVINSQTDRAGALSLVNSSVQPETQ